MSMAGAEDSWYELSLVGDARLYADRSAQFDPRACHHLRHDSFGRCCIRVGTRRTMQRSFKELTETSALKIVCVPNNDNNNN